VTAKCTASDSAEHQQHSNNKPKSSHSVRKIKKKIPKLQRNSIQY